LFPHVLFFLKLNSSFPNDRRSHAIGFVPSHACSQRITPGFFAGDTRQPETFAKFEACLPSAGPTDC
jgi:hypothetical protein